MASILVLGAGMVGSAMAIDLSHRHTITLADLDPAALTHTQQRAPSIQTLRLDVTQRQQLAALLAPFDLVVCAVPGFLGFETLRTIIEASKPVVDISFFAENALELDALARSKGVTAVVDCGVAPGMPNIVLGYHDQHMTVTDFEYVVGGLPVQRQFPFEYKAPFSPIDVLEEYTRPARFKQGGQLITKPALSDCEYRTYAEVGTLEAFNSDGLRSLLYTLPHIPNMREKTLRYPRHVEYIKVLQASGFFDEQPITIHGTSIRPIDFTAKILFEDWKLQAEEEEFTLMQIDIEGKNADGQRQRITYEVLDRYDAATQTSSMARTTGYTACAAVEAYFRGLIPDIGVLPPERIGRHADCYRFVLNYLAERGIAYRQQIVDLS